MDYHGYLKLDQILSAQVPVSGEKGKPVHDEHFFIVVHQVYELWFKQVLHDVDSILEILSGEHLDDKDISVVVQRLDRVVAIQRPLIDQISILETMTPMEFMEFRSLFGSSSGFQSVQFRLLENKLGLRLRDKYGQKTYSDALRPEFRKEVQKTEEESSLFDLVDTWLSRMPFLESKEFGFWDKYCETVQKMQDRQESLLKERKDLSDEDLQAQLKNLENSRQTFKGIMDQEKHAELVKEGRLRLSFDAIRSAILIWLYREQPIFHLPYAMLSKLVDIDELFTSWRFRHAQMVYRMLGQKIGSGGSSGYDYLLKTVTRHKIFADLANLATFLVPRSELGEVPSDLEKKLGFFYKGN